MAKFFNVPVFGNISVEAYDEEDAVERVKKVLDSYSSIAPFALNVPLPEKILSELAVGEDVYFLDEVIPKHHELYGDVGEADESILRRLRSGN